MLAAAARQGDASLASEVLRVLGERKTVLTIEHYELLLDTYLAASDLNAALSLLSIMQTAGIAPEEASTRPLVAYLRQDRSSPKVAFDELQNIHEQGRIIPLTAVNAVIQAALYNKDTAHDDGDITLAMDIFKSLPSLSTPPTPALSTFNILLRGCSESKRKDLAMFLNRTVSLTIISSEFAFGKITKMLYGITMRCER